MFGVETMIEQIANTLGKDPLDVRRINLYRDPAVSGDPSTMVTQYGQRIEDWIGDKVKSPARQKFDKIFVGVGTVVVGLCLLGGVVGVIYVVLKKILPILVK